MDCTEEPEMEQAHFRIEAATLAKFLLSVTLPLSFTGKNTPSGGA